MSRYKETSPAPYMLVFGLGCAMLMGVLYCSVGVESPKELLTLKGIETAISMFSLGGTGGAAIGAFIYVIARPSRESVTQIRLMEEQNRIINRQHNTNGFSITEELNRLNELKNNGAITEEEFNILKQKIINS